MNRFMSSNSSGTRHLRVCSLVAEHGLERVEIGIGAQHEDPVQPLVLLDLVAIDREVIVADRFQVTPVLPTSALSPLASWRSSAATIEARSAASFSAS
jgi:hypothetical protein